MIDQSTSNISFEIPFKVKKVRCIAPRNKRTVRCTPTDNGTLVDITAAAPQYYAVTIEF